MKTELKEQGTETPEIVYPCLVIYHNTNGLHKDDGMVVYKDTVNTGIVVHAPNVCDYMFGHTSTIWNCNGFSRYDGTVVLSNG
jgi:hypothetical protein